MISQKFNEALALHKNNKFFEASKIYLEILENDKNNIQLLNLIGVCYNQLNNLNKGKLYLLKAFNLDKKNFSVFENLINTLLKLNDLDYCYELTKNFLINNNLSNLGIFYKVCVALYKTFRYKKALQIINLLIEASPNNQDYLHLKSMILYLGGDANQSLLFFETALNLNENQDFLIGNYLSSKLSICNWNGYEEIKKKIESKILNNYKCILPFDALIIYDDPNLLKKNAKIWSKQFYQNKETFESSNKKIKVGYFGSIFYDHATVELIKDVFKNHDKSKFDIFAFHYNYIEDSVTDELKKNFKEFVNISELDFNNKISKIKSYKLDIAIDLNGYTKSAQTEIFKENISKIKINYLGYPGTMAAPFIDFIIADRIIIPENLKKNYTEKVIYIDPCYQPHSKIISKTQNKLRSEYGFEDEDFIYSSFNDCKKLSPIIFKLWMEILSKTKNTKLWIYVNNEIAKKNILSEFKKYKLNENRLAFAYNVSRDEHINRIWLSDVFLDTFPYNGHTTCYEALCAGVPYITVKGLSFQSRVAASILNKYDLKKFIANNFSEYVDIAVSLYRDRSSIAKNKKKISELIKSKVDVINFTLNLEKIYENILKKNYKR